MAFGFKILNSSGLVQVGGEYVMQPTLDILLPNSVPYSGTTRVWEYPEAIGCTVSVVQTDEFSLPLSYSNKAIVTVTVSYPGGIPTVTLTKSANTTMDAAYRVLLVSESMLGYGFSLLSETGDVQAGGRCPSWYFFNKYTASTYGSWPPVGTQVGIFLSATANFDSWGLSSGSGWATHRVVIPFTELPQDAIFKIYTDIPTYPSGVLIHDVRKGYAYSGGTATAWYIDLIAFGYTPSVYIFLKTIASTGSGDFGLVLRNGTGEVTLDTSAGLLGTLAPKFISVSHPSSTGSLGNESFDLGNLPAEPIMNTTSVGLAYQWFTSGNFPSPVANLVAAYAKVWSKSYDGSQIRADWKRLVDGQPQFPPTSAARLTLSMYKEIGNAAVF